MKHLLLLLFTTACFAQNAKVKAYRLVDEVDDGPCSVMNYVKWPIEGLINYVTAESNDASFAQNLLKLKKAAKSWKKQDHFCKPGTLGGDMTHNMFVIEYQGKNDTILATYDNSKIIFPNKSKSYTDEKGVLKSMFPENIKAFFEHDFNKQIRSLFFPEENDSITADKILYNGKYAADIFNEDFDEHPGNLIKSVKIPYMII